MLPRDTRLLHPAWYALPAGLFLFLVWGDPLLLARIPAIDSLSTWLLKRDGGGPTSALSLARALSLSLMPLQLLGVFWVLWPMRWWNVKIYRDRKTRPPAFLETACLLYFAGVGYAHYFLNPSTACAFCPSSTGGMAAMEAVVLFTMPYALYGIAEALHTRIALTVSSDLPPA